MHDVRVGSQHTRPHLSRILQVAGVATRTTVRREQVPSTLYTAAQCRINLVPLLADTDIGL